jgi:hypothetical protein
VRADLENFVAVVIIFVTFVLGILVGALVGRIT